MTEDEATNKPPICDFCSEPNPRWQYPASDFIMHVPGPDDYGSEGAWAACDACHDLIEAGDGDGLAKRSADKFARNTPGMPRSFLLSRIRELHEGFWSRRKGPAQPLN